MAASYRIRARREKTVRTWPDVKLHAMLQRLRQFFEDHERIFVLTGAGISTASGIPDYRDRQGDWKHRRPMEYREFLATESARQRYWARSYFGWQRFAAASPNAAHLALARLEQHGLISLTVTQNVDGLQQRAGSRRVIELHGSLERVLCHDCGQIMARVELQRELRQLNPELASLSAELAPDGDARLNGFDTGRLQLPDCPDCGGILRPGVVFFGENVPAERVRESFAALERADAMLVVGSSLMVYSGFRFVREARKRSLPIAAINLGVTRADDMLNLKIELDCGEALSACLD